MNVVACDRNPRDAAIALADRHLAPMSRGALHALIAIGEVLGTPVPGVFPSNPGHLTSRIVVAAVADPNYRTYIVEWALQLASEYTYRVDAGIGHQILIENCEFLADEAPPSDETWAKVEFPVVMDSEYRVDDPIASYRNALTAGYAFWAADGRPPRWTRRNKPSWLHYLVPLGREAA